MRIGARLIISLALLVIIITLLFRSPRAVLATTTGAAPTVPRRAWSFWEKNPPKEVLEIVNRNRRLLGDTWDYRFLTAETLPSVIDTSTFPEQYYELEKPCHRADYVRLALLRKYGGCWLDSSILLNPDGVVALNRMAGDIERSGAQVALFSLGDPAVEYLENWFIMAPTGSPVIDLWFQEFDKAVRISFLAYKKDVELAGIPISPRIYKPGAFNANWVYLTQHACLQVVLKTKLKGYVNVLVYRSEDTMFRLQVECNWKKACTRWRLANDPNLEDIPFIKLRSEDRA